LSWLSIPTAALAGFEPSQLVVLSNTLADGALPQATLLAATDNATHERLAKIRLTKATRSKGDREEYPDYEDASGCRVEPKGLFVDNPALGLKRPKSKREAVQTA
jgi:hypothetical protein